MEGRTVGRTISIVAIAVLLVVSLAGIALAGRGPAPNSGDGVCDGSGFQGDWGEGMGPAPNSGDGVDDGPGW
jgi:hypothetical protein